MENYMMSDQEFLGDASLYLPALTEDLRNTMMDAMDKFPIGIYLGYNGAILAVFSDEYYLTKYGKEASEYLNSCTDKIVFIVTYWEEGLVELYKCECIFDSYGWRL